MPGDLHTSVDRRALRNAHCGRTVSPRPTRPNGPSRRRAPQRGSRSEGCSMTRDRYQKELACRAAIGGVDRKLPSQGPRRRDTTDELLSWSHLDRSSLHFAGQARTRISRVPADNSTLEALHSAQHSRHPPLGPRHGQVLPPRLLASAKREFTDCELRGPTLRAGRQRRPDPPLWIRLTGPLFPLA
jgi:hypothetical protein